MKDRTFGNAHKTLGELTDRELEEELIRRRRARAQRREPSADRHSPQAKQLDQYYANLELSPGASRDEIRRAYRDLMRRYHPDKHLADTEKHRAATDLAQSLTRAYRALLEHLDGKTGTTPARKTETD